MAGTTAPATQPFGVTTTTSPFISITPTQNSSSSPEPVNQGSNGGALWLGRLLSTIGILALFGGLALIAIGWPEGPEYVVTVRYLRAVWIIALIGTVLYLIAYAAKYHDSSFGAAINPSDWLDLKDDGWPGRAALLRLGFVLGSGWAAMRPERIIDPATAMWAWAIPGGALIAVALSRVDGPLPWLGVGIGFLHVLGAAVWFGGVAIVARVVLAGPGEEDLLHATRAFSRMSTKAMVLVIVTGLAQTIRLDGNPFGSSHGQVVLLKAVAVAAMIAVGLEARRQVGYRLDRAHEMTVGLADRFRRAFGAETAIGVVVLAFSGWLLSLEPAKVDKFADEAYTREIAFVDPSTGIDARVFIGPGGGRPQRLQDRGQRAAGGDHQPGVAVLPAGREREERDSPGPRARPPPARSCSRPTRASRSRWRARGRSSSADRPRSERNRAPGATFLVDSADGTRGRRHQTARPRRPCPCRCQSSIKQRRAPHSSRPRHRRRRQPPRRDPSLTNDQPDSASSSSKLTGLATSNCS